MLTDKKINLDLPVDAYDAEGNLKEKPENISEEVSTEVSQTKEKVENTKEEGGEDEQRVPYSRFKKVREEREQAIQEAEDARQLIRDLSREREAARVEEPSAIEEEIRQTNIRLWGDTPVAKEMTDLQIRQQRAAEQRAIDAFDRRQNQETQAISQNENEIETRLETLSDSLGRDLSLKEENQLLEIVDEFTPTGEDGKYLGEILSFEKAMEIMELRNTGAAQTTRRSRSVATQAASERSSGDPSADRTEQDKNFNPRNWNSLWSRIK